MTSLRILLYNVLHWQTRKNEFLTSMPPTPDVILINSHGLNDSERLKIFSYNTYQRNKSRERADGVALAVKKGLQHRIINDFDHEFMAVEINTTKGHVILATGYLPPHRPFPPYPDFLRLIRLHTSVYFLGDLNARHRTLGNQDKNTVGNSISSLVGDNRLQHLGPTFPTLIRHNSATSPDIVVSSRHGHFNYHLPVILDISINPILILTTPRFDHKNADWDKYKERLENKLSNDLNGKSAVVIDLETENWFWDILEAKKASIPIRTYWTTPYPSHTPDLHLLQTLYQGIRTLANLRGWNQELRQQLCRIRERLLDTCRTHYDSKWAELTAQLSSKAKGQKEFWRQLKTLMGNDVRHSS